jgi:hypothetical protein
MEDTKNTFTFQGVTIKIVKEWTQQGPITVPSFTFVVTEEGDEDEPPLKKMRTS